MADLSTEFDAVVMLTWSDWRTEPRSNRYHYATRFAKQLPVFFVQATTADTNSPVVEPAEVENIFIVHAGKEYGRKQSLEIERVLAEHNVRRLLIWIYNPDFCDFIYRKSRAFIVYHATEDYFRDLDPWENALSHTVLHEKLIRVFGEIDLLVAVSDGVLQRCIERAGYSGSSFLAENGCDARFWRSNESYKFEHSGDNRVALYQGGINDRLDFRLLKAVIDRMPDWEFWFCGRANKKNESWQKLLLLKNVRYLGELNSERISSAMRRASVGIIPFVSKDYIHLSMPLKAFEYIAAGLPVVSTRIDSLIDRPDLFAVVDNAADFEVAIRERASSREDEDAISARLSAAARRDYDVIFQSVCQRIISERRAQSELVCKYNVLVLHDAGSIRIGAVEEYLNAFRSHSRHSVHYMNASRDRGVVTKRRSDPENSEIPELDFSAFDCVVLHYSIRLCLEDHIGPDVADGLANFSGMKILVIQDEYDHVEMTLQWMEKIRFDHVLTCVPEEHIDAIYPRSRFPNTRFTRVLTGYVSENSIYDRSSIPMSERDFRIVYRGRALPYRYGNLGREKYDIGFDVKRLASEYNVPVDIEVDDTHRIYGGDWPKFLASGRATLGTESGSNVFDFDGSLDLRSKTHADMNYRDFHSRFLAEREGNIRMNQISPKLFEAIQVRTALILFEGDYSGILEPHTHYIPLKKDYSNIEQVFKCLEDLKFLKSLTDRAYHDIIRSGKYSYKEFVGTIDDLILSFCVKPPRSEFVLMPVAARRRNTKEIDFLYSNERGRSRFYVDSLLEPAQLDRVSGQFDRVVGLFDSVVWRLNRFVDRTSLVRGIWRACTPIKVRNWVYGCRVRFRDTRRILPKIFGNTEA